MFDDKKSLTKTIPALLNFNEELTNYLQYLQWSSLFISNPGLLEVDIEVSSEYDDEGGYYNSLYIRSAKFDNKENLLAFARNFNFFDKEYGKELSLEDLEYSLEDELNVHSLEDLGITLLPTQSKIYKRNQFTGQGIIRLEENFIKKVKQTTNLTQLFEFLLELTPKVLNTQDYLYVLSKFVKGESNE